MLTFEEQVLCGNLLQRFGSGLEPDLEPTRKFGPVAHTRVPGASTVLGLAYFVVKASRGFSHA
jgi:hypothetical protein